MNAVHACNQVDNIAAIKRHVEVLDQQREVDSSTVLAKLEDIGGRVEGIAERLDVVGARVSLLTEWRREQKERRMTWRTVAIAILPSIVTATGAYLVASHAARPTAAAQPAGK